MNPAVLSMLSRYQCLAVQDYENALKEIMQELALLGLWRSKFFEHAAFYGGTALRILYGLDRFSEDLDFSLLKAQDDFDLAPYLSAISAELNAMGFAVTVEQKEKSFESAIESAFIKAVTREHLIKITVPETVHNRIKKNAVLKVKLELDTNPPPGFHTDAKVLMQPIPFSVNTYKLPDLFAGKLHALIHRQWKNRVKGRDYYDFVWYIGRKVPVHLAHLEQRLRQSGGWTADRAMQHSDLIDLLKNKFADINIDAVRNEVSPFVRDQASLSLWSPEFFESLLAQLQIE